MKKIITTLIIALFVLVLGSPCITLATEKEQVKSIKILKYPTKCSYNMGEGYSIDGLSLEAVLSNGEKVKVDNSQITSFSGVELAEGRAFVEAGWKGVTLKYKGATTSYGIAVFDPTKDYYITYDTDGGNEVKPEKIDASTKAFTLPIPKKKGYTFAGWYHSNGNKYTKYTSGMGPSLELKAKWTNSIIFDKNGGTGTMKNGEVSQDYKLPKSGFKRNGYKFVGWSTKKEATSLYTFYVVGNPSSYISNVKGNIRLYAQWVKPATYKITFGSVKGVKVKNPIKKYTSGKTTELPYPDLSTDKNFGGWKITKNGINYGTYTEIPPFMTGNLKLTPELVAFEG